MHVTFFKFHFFEISLKLFSLFLISPFFEISPLPHPCMKEFQIFSYAPVNVVEGYVWVDL